MKHADSRRIAFEVLCDVLDKDAYSNLLLPRRLQDSQLEARDRAFTTELVYGTLRLQGRLDYYITQLSHRSLDQLELQIQVLLRMGLFQLLELKMPPHAAVFETTEVAKAVVGKSAASFIHAILREGDRKPPTLPPDESLEAISIRTSHPEWIVRALSDSLGKSEEVEALLNSHNLPAWPTLNALPGRVTSDELLQAGALAIEGAQRAFIFRGNPGDLDSVRLHSTIVQDHGSQIVVEQFFQVAKSLHPDRPLRWLDLCAGPGGKAAYLDALITDGDFIANEISEHRARLVSNVVRRGQITHHDGRSLPPELGKFDAILIDAPCTGLGALRRRPEVRWRRTPNDLGSLQNLQRELLHSAASICEIGGVLGYSTCSPHLAETTLQVMRFLAEHPNFERIETTSPSCTRDGDLQLWTHRDGTDSMFLSLLKRRS